MAKLLKVAIPSGLLILLVSFIAGKFYVENKIKNIISIAAKKQEANLKLTFENVRVRFLNPGFTVENISVSFPKNQQIIKPIQIDCVVIDQIKVDEILKFANGEMDTLNSSLSSIRTKIVGIHLNSENAPTLAPLLEQQNLDELNLNLVGFFEFNKKTKNYAVKELSIEGRDFLKINLGLEFGQFEMLDTNFKTHSQLEIMSQLMGVTIKRMTLSVHDKSFLVTLKDNLKNDNRYASLFQNLNSNLAQTNVVSSGGRLPASVQASSFDLETRMKSALSAFLVNPKDIELQIQPNQPIKIQELALAFSASPGLLAEMLNLQLKVNGLTY